MVYDKSLCMDNSGRYSIILGAIKCRLVVILVQVEISRVLQCILI